MADLQVRIYGNEAEIISYSAKERDCLTVDLGEPLDGFIATPGDIHKLTRGRCRISTDTIPDGEFAPAVILDSRSIPLPRLVKDGNKILPIECDATFIRGLSRRERMLENKVSSLEERLRELEERVLHTHLF